jgi:cytochrome c peroxidase
MRIWLFAALLIWGIGSCQFQREGDLRQYPYHPTPHPLKEPEGFVQMVQPEDNPLTEEGIALGRKLFFEPLLSLDSSVSCASCHLPHLAFSDMLDRSRGVNGRLSNRNTPSLANVGYYYKGLFWDGRVLTLEEQSLHPVADTLEMANTWDEVEYRLKNHPEYPAMFRSAFGIRHISEIDRHHVGKALAQFQRTLISADSRFDKKMRGALTFTPQEQRGWTIFFDAAENVPHAECAHCHADPLFTNLDFANNGIDSVSDLRAFPDAGRGAISHNIYENGTFRVPGLRNIALTAPYMHDGRFATLEEVIDHYASGGHYADNLNPNIMPLRLDARDKADLIAFLETLTDTAFLKKECTLQ